MPHFDIVRHVEPNKTFRVASVMGTYDLQTEKVAEHFVGDIELPEQWQVGLIVGNSGTGKTTIARELFADAYIENFDYTHESILDDMPQGIPMETITKTFNAVGFSSPPSWLKPYAVLSNGEKMRCDLARAMLSDNEMFVFDEFTSVVDRNIAKIGSFAIQKAIRKTNRRMIAVTCHFDVEDWLMPDWVFYTNDMTFHIRDGQKKIGQPSDVTFTKSPPQRENTALANLWQISLSKREFQQGGRCVRCNGERRFGGILCRIAVSSPKVEESKEGASDGCVARLSRHRIGRALVGLCGRTIPPKGLSLHQHDKQSCNGALPHQFAKMGDKEIATSHGNKQKFVQDGHL